MMLRLGIDQESTAELRRAGIADIDAIEALDDEDIRKMCIGLLRTPHPQRPANVNVYFSAPAIKNMQALRYWIKLQRRTGVVPVASDFTVQELAETRERIREIKAYHASEDDQEVVKPQKLKLMSKWVPFWESLLTYFGSIGGAADIPLTYVFRDEATVTDEHRGGVYPTWDDYYIRCTVLETEHYVADNTRVWNKIKPLIYDGPGWDFIRHHEATRDSRGAILALRDQNESLNSKTTRKNRAYKALSALVYTGPRKNFTFENYVSAHLHSHNELRECGEAVPETKKVNDF